MKGIPSLLLGIFLIAGIQPSFSQATRTWVSGVGDDVNPCSRTAPCKTLAGAISKTAVGGEINILDPAGYGSVTITKSITIDGGGIMGSILASGTNGIIVDAPGATVTIRNFSINGAGTGINGIKVMAIKKLAVEGCTVSNFTANAIDINATGVADIVLNNVTIQNAASGVSMINPGFLVVDNCRVQGMQNDGVSINGGRSSISSSLVSGCTTGIVSTKGSSVHLFANSIVNNGTGLQGPGTFTSAENNSITRNRTVGALPVAEKQQ